MRVESALASTIVISSLFAMAAPAIAQPSPPQPPPAEPAPEPDRAEPNASPAPSEPAPAPAPAPSSPAAPAAPPVLRGTVTAGESKTPQVGAGVSITELGAYVFTDANGQFSLAVPPGPHVVRIEAPGYLPVEKTVEVGAEPTSIDVQIDETRMGEVITIIGARTARSRLETPVPVDVIGADVIGEASQSETNQVLNIIAPSFNATHQSITDGTDHIDPADLRGLGPEHVLVLINGKRLHQSSLMNVYSGGTVGVDLNAIPTAAIARIEVLRDGAASQYGSDAIAGVINIVLKDNVDLVDLYTMTGVTGSGDGAQFKLGGNTGFRLGDRGFVNVTGEFFARGRTNRSGPWSGDIFPGITGKADTDAELARRGLTRDDFTMDVGDAGALVGTGFANAGYKLDDTFQLYAQGGYTLRKGYASGFYRFPGAEDRVDLRVYPNGFLPQINPLLNAWTGTAGVRGKRGPWEGDLSVTYGGDSFHFFIDHSLNASLGLLSPTHFDAGKINFHQTSLNLDGVRRIEHTPLAAVSLVAGGEVRLENYSIKAGEPASYELGPETTMDGTPKSPGSQVFPGFRPSDESNNDRTSEALYAGIESQPTTRTNLDVGARFEHYSDFGNTVTGKVAGRVAVAKFADNEVALRGSASTGFRAPGLQQIWYSTIATQFVNADGGGVKAENILISPNHSDVTAQAFGVPRLKEETSVNAGGGLTAHLASGVSLSADYYHVTIKDRVVLSGQFLADDSPFGMAVGQILSPFAGVSAAQFFVNAVDTTTNGVDVVADYSYRLSRGTIKAIAAANFTTTHVDAVHVPDSMQQRFANVPGGTDQVATTFLGRYGRNRLEDLLPHQKGTLGVRYDAAGWSAGVRGNFAGPTVYRSDGGPALDEKFSAQATFDVDVGYRFPNKLYLSIGASNVFNTFPPELKNPDNRNNDSFLYSPAAAPAGAPFGTEGGFYYLRAEYQH